MNIIWRIWGWFTRTPPEQLACDHPEWARDARLNLLPEEEGMDFYEVCTLCDMEFRD